MRARHSEMLRASQRAQHDDEAHSAGDDPFADIHEHGRDERDDQDEHDDSSERDHHDERHDIDEIDDIGDDGVAHREPSLNGTGSLTFDNTASIRPTPATDPASMRYAGHPTTPRKSAMHSESPTRR